MSPKEAKGMNTDWADTWKEVDAEAMEEYKLLACSSWLPQTAVRQNPKAHAFWFPHMLWAESSPINH